MTKLVPEWVRTSDPVIRSPARYALPIGCSVFLLNSSGIHTLIIIIIYSYIFT